MAAIEAEKLRRTYRQTSGFVRRRTKTIEAVRGIDFEVNEGELFGLLGPNGAGKTTTIKMLVTLLIPTSGAARVLGHDVVHDARTVRRNIGYVFGGDRGAYERLSGLDNLRYFSELYGVPPKVQKRRIPELLELVGLMGREKERVEGYSRGMKQRLHIARGLLHDPPVVVLDEPTIGLDPVGARELRHTIAELARDGKTVLLTTHYMYEADALCDRLAGLGWVFQLKMLSRSSFDGLLGVLWPLFFATTAFFMFRTSHDARTLLYAALGSSVMGIWSSTSVAASSALQRERWYGTLELVVGTPAHFSLVLIPITLAMSTVGIYSMAATLLWGRFLFGIGVHIVHPLLFVIAVPATVLAIGLLGFLLSVTVVRYRTAWALGNAL